MAEHTVKAFDLEISDLQRKIAEMGGLAEKMISDAMDALTHRDANLAQVVIETDLRLDALQREVEENAILIIARRQPMAIDLRDCVAAIRIASDLERVGDLARSVCKRIVTLNAQFAVPRAVTGLVSLSRLALAQLKMVLDSYTARDESAARDVWSRDNEIDALYTSLFRELLTYMMEDPRNIGFCTHLLFSAKNVERIGDHATNIAETVHYLVTGSTLPIDRPRADDSMNQMAGVA